ncbi:CoA transferase [Pseudomonas aeruginosa]|uniref:CoA transferase n=1 Tax=Pseudomonas aeruginosa TaxID=287 RepID=UPI0031B6CF0B
MNTILAGMRVIEVSAYVAAPLGGMTLAQMGAEVIRIDGLRGGLDYRRWPVTEDDTSLFWCGLNKAKRSVAIDIASEEGRELATALICAEGADAGMLLTNMPARGWLDWELLRQRRADLIQLTVQGDRHGGSAVDYTVNPSVGLPLLTGPELADASVVNHVLPAWDLITGQMAAAGLLAAERHRRLTGQGQHVQLALEDVALAVIAHLGFTAEAELGGRRERVGNYLYGAFGRDFVLADGARIMVVGLTARQWKGLCEATGLQEPLQALAQQLGLDWSREGDRYRARQAIAALFEPWFASQTLARVAPLLDRHGVCWSRYREIAEVVASLAGDETNPMFSSVRQPGVGTLLTPGLPLRFSACERQEARPAPRLGEHTERVLSELLGLSSAEFGKLVDRGVVAVARKEDA